MEYQKNKLFINHIAKDQCDDASSMNHLIKSFFSRLNLCIVHFLSLPINIITYVYSVSCTALVYSKQKKDFLLFFTLFG